MAHILFFILLILLIIEPSQCIANGTSSQHPHPYFVTLLQPRLCGGVFLSLAPEAWVLTAAHCLSTGNTTTMGKVHYGRHRQQNFHHAIIHPKYPRKRIEDDDERTIQATIYDLALIRLDKPILPSDDSYSSIYYHAMDPGYEKKSREEFQTIQISTTPSSSSLECMGKGATSLEETTTTTATTAIKTNKRRMMTAVCDWTNNTRAIGIFKPYQDAVSIISTHSTLCHGDSGGPLVNSDHRLVGILSRILYAYDPIPTKPTCPLPESEDLPMTNVFVKPTFHLEWISQVTGLDLHTLTTPPANTSPSSYFDILHSSRASIHLPNSWWLPIVVVVVVGTF